MDQPIYIRYVGNEEDDSIIPFKELGESLIGFDKTLKRIASVLRIRCDVELRAKATSDGSLIVDALVQFASTANELFGDIESFLEFTKVCSKEAWLEAVEYFNSVENGLNSLNDYYAKRPVNLALTLGAISYLYRKAGEIGRRRKGKSDAEIIKELRDEIPERIVKEVLSLLKKKSFHRAMRPIIEEVAESIEIDTDKHFNNPIKIDQNNFQDYLTEDDQVLPDLLDGQSYPFEGSITSIKSTRGDSMTFHAFIDDQEINFDLYPADGTTTKSYLNFYQERSHLTATVLRKSMYKKPKLKMETITLDQGELGLSEYVNDEEERELEEGEQGV